MKGLQEKGIIKTGNYNKSAYDRTLWYAFTDLGKSIVSNRQMEMNKSSNGNEQNGLTIPDINTDDKTKDIKTNKKEKKAKAMFVLKTQGKTLSQAVREMTDKLAEEFDKKNSK